MLVRCIQQDGGKLKLTVEDDGRGISASHLRVAAVKRGMMSLQDATKLSGADLLNLLFSPGFSTVTKPDEHAGRGVGLDVVRTTVNSFGGHVGVSAKRGEGTRFTLSLPGDAARRAA